ncbi:DUF4383 domain-containing protein [Streptomyces sp. NRRL S-337]|uniref:DUF4383 domain-containing protein n=1 Tax=Streptomyces sp. NRRL S-337 TaxID=1463900 RepID=UPI0004C9352A|nr:DUF4383 domain-containing protein [Streptomyces sp. NRRL S-337]
MPTDEPPGVTTHYDQMSFADPHGAGSLFGLFAVSMLHNLVHVVFGMVALGVLLAPRNKPGQCRCPAGGHAPESGAPGGWRRRPARLAVPWWCYG